VIAEQPAIREAGLADLDAIVGVINEAYLVERFFVTGPRVSAPDVLSLMEKGAFLAACNERGRVVASVYAEPRGGRGYVGLLAVARALQGRGIGRLLMNAAEERLGQQGCRAVDIKVVSLRTELPPFYERLGYRENGTEPFDDPRKTRPCHFLLMSKALAGRSALK
jgi:GNAT superfamily N-acetyltransferase